MNVIAIFQTVLIAGINCIVIAIVLVLILSVRQASRGNIPPVRRLDVISNCLFLMGFGLIVAGVFATCVLAKWDEKGELVATPQYWLALVVIPTLAFVRAMFSLRKDFREIAQDEKNGIVPERKLIFGVSLKLTQRLQATAGTQPEANESPLKSMTLAELEEQQPEEARALIEALSPPRGWISGTAPPSSFRAVLRASAVMCMNSIVFFGLYRLIPLFEEYEASVSVPRSLRSLQAGAARAIAASDAGKLPPGTPEASSWYGFFDSTWGPPFAPPPLDPHWMASKSEGAYGPLGYWQCPETKGNPVWLKPVRWWRSADRQFGVLIANGPDKDADISEQSFLDIKALNQIERQIAGSIYDPTNGVLSSGDIVTTVSLQ